MSWRTEPDTLILDYDGTLHDCLRIYAPAFRTVWGELEAAGLNPPPEVSDARVRSWLGLSVQGMWDDFMPQLEPEVQSRYGARIGEEMFRLVQAGEAALYPGAEDALVALRLAGHHLVFLSNCPHDYMEAHRQHFRLDRWFDGYLCSGDYPGKAKWEIYKAARESFPGRHLVIGDRWSDMEIATVFQLPSIGCLYGYGVPEELEDAAICIADISELPQAVSTLLP